MADVGCWVDAVANARAGFKTIPANIATFRIGADGKLTFAHSYEVDTHPGTQFWSGMVGLG